MMPPSTYRPPLSVIICATSRAVPGEIAFTSTYSPRNPCTAQATSVAACGGHTDKITSASPATLATFPASFSAAALARSAVAALRPSDAHKTVYPRLVRHRPTAAPISPGCSSPITCMFTHTSVAQRAAPVPGRAGIGWQAPRQPSDARSPVPQPGRLPGGLEEPVGAVGDRRELAPGQDAQDVRAAVRVLLAPGVGDDQGAAIGAGPEDVLPADRGAEPVFVEERLAGLGGVLSDLDVTAGAGEMRWVEAGRGDDPGAVRREQRVGGGEGAGPVREPHDDLGRGERLTGGSCVQHADVHGLVEAAAPLLERQIAAI